MKTFKPLLLIPALGLVLLLSACAGPMPKADPSEAWIGLQEEALCKSFIDKFVELHQVDYAACGLADLGKPQG